MLSEKQIAIYKMFGFIVLRQVLNPDDLVRANADFEIGLAVAEKAMTRTEQRGQITWSNLEADTPFLASLLEDSRFHGPATQILGDETIGSYSRSTSFDGNVTGWHPDVSWPEWEGIKFGFYLQPVTETTGALRLIPGSHHDPLYSALDSINFGTPSERSKDRTAVTVDDLPAFIATSLPGDVVAFDNRTWHASYGGFKGRSLCTIAYFAAPKSDAQKEAVKQYVGMEAGLRRTWPLMNRSSDWRANIERNPTRQKWIDALEGYGFFANDD